MLYFSLFAFAVMGRLLIVLWKKAPYKDWISGLPKVGKFFEELFSCDLCFGVWVYFLLDFLFQVNLLGIDLPPVGMELLTGCLMSFLMWVFVAGWSTLFQNVMIIPEE